MLLYQNDVKVNFGLVYLYMYMHFDIHSCGTQSAVTGLAQEPRDLINELPFEVSPAIPLDPIKTLYSVA